MTRTIKSLLGALAIGLLWTSAASVQASTLEIQFLGLDLVYDGTDIYDATSALGGSGITTLADPLESVAFIVDGTTVGTLSTDIWADILIRDVSDIPVGGGLVTSGGQGDDFGFDILTDSTTGFGLALNLDTVDVFYLGGNIAIGGGALATSVPLQDLPFGLVLDDFEDVTIAFSSANLTGITDDGTFLTGFDASGTGNVNGQLVPEPSTFIMAAMGLMSVLFLTRRKV